ncbi:Tim44 domain-containing protein [Ancylobacter amanitiformis]|uniref:Lipid-binding transport protein (Tim44 family) n=1 Tax=Ancylobacter amanitiformis TaxID=217069 RepID=A0ABU0LM11_9HYPH|nr:TIM44-like domain-containing protein [Ancylobacter amanitiformis]MDQ0509653.1 putative lipid-binding transport protein (Tim44 family) [Ancylobacter amanitiformis]
MSKPSRSRSAALRVALAALFVAASCVVAMDFAEARAGRSMNMGSRGSRTWSTPAPTPTAPSAQPMQRSAAPQTQPGSAATAAAGARPGGFFNRGGFMGGLMGGLLGAGLFGLLMGSGFFSGLGSLSGILGLLLQVGLIFIVVRLVMGWLRNRNQPSFAGGAGSQPSQRSALDGAAGPSAPLGGGSATAGVAAGGRAGFGSAPRGRPLTLQASDFDAFEQRLGDVQGAYGRDDRAALAQVTTPEMLAYLGEDLDDLARDGLQNTLTDVKLLQGDLSEAWSEDGRDYATVAMRYELKDATIERATGRLVQGDPDRATQVIEFWTFARESGGAWKLSAIQQGRV